MAFDSRVSRAIDIIYRQLDFYKGVEAFDLLREAAADGDADAHYFLGRCYAGTSFVNEGFNFPEDDDIALDYINKSMELGSAVGMFGARRVGGIEPVGGTFVHAPYNSDREVWDAVVELALEGELFCELLIANAYYYGDSVEFLGIDVENMPDEQAFFIIRSMILAAADMYEDILSNGMFMAWENYKDIITSGDYGIKPDQEKYKWLKKICAERGESI